MIRHVFPFFFVERDFSLIRTFEGLHVRTVSLLKLATTFYEALSVNFFFSFYFYRKIDPSKSKVTLRERP